jgi:hypothetical protein
MTVAIKLATTSPEDTGSDSKAEKRNLSPQLLELTQSLGQWEVPVSAKDAREEPFMLPLQSIAWGISAEPAYVPPSRVSPPPGLAEVKRLCWTIDKAKVMLASSDHIRISPSMDVPIGEGQAPAKFKMMLRPKIISECRGGACFRRSKGQCYIELKCEEGQDVIGNTQFSFWVGEQSPRGPIEHNFSSDAVGRLPKDVELWDVKKSIGQMPRDPELWDLKASVPDGCLVVGVEILVFTAN